jgi:Phage integrase, N-terminal SAM-like domain
VAYAEKRGNLWRARWRGPDGALESKPGFTSRKDAENYGRDQEAAIRSNTYVDPRAGQMTLTQWANEWYPAQDLEPTTLANYRYALEVHILPEFGHRALKSITAQEVGKWEMGIVARGFSRRTARDARTVLTTLYGDAIPRYVQVNPAQRRRGKGRKGQRRIERNEQAEKVRPTPMQALLVAERCATLSGRDEDFLMVIAGAYTGCAGARLPGSRPSSCETTHSALTGSSTSWVAVSTEAARRMAQYALSTCRRSLPNCSLATSVRAKHAPARAAEPRGTTVPGRATSGARVLPMFSSALTVATIAGPATGNATSARPLTVGIRLGRTGQRGRY